nr:S-layer homology domain-containing protein [Clostridia bacterium]
MSNLKAFIKKLISMALAALMITGTGVGIMAKSYDDVKTEHEYREQIDILSDIGVIVGTSDKEFSPDEKVTREQMAMLLFRLMLGRSNAGTTNSTDFTDLYDETYHGAISWANAAGYIIGTSDSTFEPTGGITLQDAMTMAVRALGQSNANMDKGYPWTYIDAALKLGLDTGLGELDYEATLTRSQTAALLYNALTAEYLISKTASNGQTIVTPTTIIEYVFGYELDNGIISATNTHSIDENDLVIKTGYVTVDVEGGRTMTVKFEDLGLDG